jgi:hypothetical protein
MVVVVVVVVVPAPKEKITSLRVVYLPVTLE